MKRRFPAAMLQQVDAAANALMGLDDEREVVADGRTRTGNSGSGGDAHMPHESEGTKCRLLRRRREPEQATSFG